MPLDPFPAIHHRQFPRLPLLPLHIRTPRLQVLFIDCVERGDTNIVSARRSVGNSTSVPNYRILAWTLLSGSEKASDSEARDLPPLSPQQFFPPTHGGILITLRLWGGYCAKGESWSPCWQLSTSRPTPHHTEARGFLSLVSIVYQLSAADLPNSLHDSLGWSLLFPAVSKSTDQTYPPRSRRRRRSCPPHIYLCLMACMLSSR